MSINVDLLIPSFSIPFAGGSLSTALQGPESLNGFNFEEVLDQCATTFGVDGSDVELFKMVNDDMDVRIGCYISGSSLTIDTINHTMQQNKFLQELLTKTSDALIQLQQQRQHDMEQLMMKNNELLELKLAFQELKSEIKQQKAQQQMNHLQQNTNNNTTNSNTFTDDENQLYKPELSRSQLLDDTRPLHNTKFMNRLMNNINNNNNNNSNTNNNNNNNNNNNSPPHHLHSLAATAPHPPSPGISPLVVGSPSSPNLSFSTESIPPGPSGIISPLELNDISPPNHTSLNSDMVSENLRKKLIALAKDGPYYSYSSGLNMNSSSPPSRPLTANRPVPPSGPRPGSHASPRIGSRVLSRATLQWDLAEAAANGTDERSSSPSITSTLTMLPRASTPKNIRVTTPRTNSSPRRPFLDNSSFHLSTPSGVVQLPTGNTPPNPHDHLIVRGKNV